MLYNWSDRYQQELNSGDDYTLLTPAVSIWLRS
jgi:hypothetical protein